MDLKGRHLLKLLDFTPEEILYLVDHADELKAKKKQGIPTLNHPGKNIALIFEKNSTRTRCSFEVAANDLGMHTTFLDPSASQIGKKESIADTARVLGRIYDGIEYRGFDQSIVDDLAKYAGVPVWNGLTNQFHPTQVLADIMTIREKFGYLKGIKMTYMGDAGDGAVALRRAAGGGEESVYGCPCWAVVYRSGYLGGGKRRRQRRRQWPVRAQREYHPGADGFHPVPLREADGAGYQQAGRACGLPG